jgi:hypothetical protein
VLHGILDSNFKLYAFVVNGLIKWEIEKPSLVRVFQSSLKTSRCTTTDDARGTIAKVASEAS